MAQLLRIDGEEIQQSLKYAKIVLLPASRDRSGQLVRKGFISLY
jgi:hypothetical protein